MQGGTPIPWEALWLRERGDTGSITAKPWGPVTTDPKGEAPASPSRGKTPALASSKPIEAVAGAGHGSLARLARLASDAIASPLPCITR